MAVSKDTGQGWLVDFPKERTRPYEHDVVENGPWVDELYDHDKTTYKPVVLWVGYGANNPVTITWRADGEVLDKMTNRVRQSSTSLRLSKGWLMQNPNMTYKVTVKDQKIGKIYSVNPTSSSCRVSIEQDY